MNKLIKPIAMSTAMLMACACSGSEKADEKIIDKPDFKSQNGIFDIEALEALGRVSSPVVSPDKSKVLFSISYESVGDNASNADLYVMNADGTDQKRITRTPNRRATPYGSTEAHRLHSFTRRTVYPRYGLWTPTDLTEKQSALSRKACKVL